MGTWTKGKGNRKGVFYRLQGQQEDKDCEPRPLWSCPPTSANQELCEHVVQKFSGLIEVISEQSVSASPSWTPVEHMQLPTK